MRILPSYQKFVWNESEYRKHIGSVLDNIGEFLGQHYCLVQSSDSILLANYYVIKDSCIFNNQEKAIDSFLHMEPFERTLNAKEENHSSAYQEDIKDFESIDI